jgi:hypothetical protein
MVAVVLAVCLFVSSAAFAGDVTITITGMACSTAIQRAIKAEMDKASPGDVITVDGSFIDATHQTNLNVPEGVTVKWAAEYVINAGVNGIYIGGTRTGTFEVVDGGSITLTAGKSDGYAISTNSRTATIKVSGGTIVANGAPALKINNGHVEVSGGRITATGDNNFAIHARGDITVSGGEINGKVHSTNGKIHHTGGVIN